MNPHLPGPAPTVAHHSLRLALSVFLPFAVGYFLSYVFRIIIAIIAPALITELGLTPAQLGLLSSVYFLAFGLMQLPLGMLLDRFGAKRVNAALLLVAALGALLFALAQGLVGLALGRALIGAGVSACMMAAFQAFTYWFPPGRLPAINGYLLFVGSLGAISATAPAEWLLGITDWRGLFIGLAAASAAAALGVFTLVPEQPEPPAKTEFKALLSGLASVYRDRLFWQVAPVSAISLGASLSMLGLWAGPWLRDVMGLERDGVAHYLLIGAAGMGVGYLLLGGLATRLARFGVRPHWISAAGMLGFLSTMIWLASGRVTHPGVLFAAFGFLATSPTLNFAVMSQHFGRELAGRANTALNMLVFASAFALQWGVGAIIGAWPSDGGGYAESGYCAAFSTLALLQALGLSWWLLSLRRR